MIDQFQVLKWHETELDLEGVTLAEVEVEYQGSLKGIGKIYYLIHYSEESTASFTGVETFSGDIDGKQGEVSLSHTGRFSGGKVQGNAKAILNSGRNEMEGLEGEIHYHSGGEKSAAYQMFFD